MKASYDQAQDLSVRPPSNSQQLGRSAKTHRLNPDLNERLADQRLQRALLKLHAAIETEEVIAAILDLMELSVPSRYLGIVFQFVGPMHPRIMRMKPALQLTPEQWNRCCEISPAGYYAATHPGCKVWTNRDMFTDEEWQRTEAYREFAVPLDFHYTVSVGAWQRDRLLGCASALRSTTEGDFTDCELELLRWLHPYLEAAITRLDRLHAERNARTAVEQLLGRLPLPTLLLDWELKLIHCNQPARETCIRWTEGPNASLSSKGRNGWRVPEPLLEACRKVRVQWDGQMLDRYTLMSAVGKTITHPARPELRANLHLVQRSVGSIAKPIFRIEFLPTSVTAGPNAERRLSIGSHLTRRERELVELICQGAANKEIADRLNLSIGTIKKELNTLYTKLEVHSRTQLMALMR